MGYLVKLNFSANGNSFEAIARLTGTNVCYVHNAADGSERNAALRIFE
jgi:hypothetical protein